MVPFCDYVRKRTVNESVLIDLNILNKNETLQEGISQDPAGYIHPDSQKHRGLEKQIVELILKYLL